MVVNNHADVVAAVVAAAVVVAAVVVAAVVVDTAAAADDDEFAVAGDMLLVVASVAVMKWRFVAASEQLADEQARHRASSVWLSYQPSKGLHNYINNIHI